jgi:hypothetical protein
MFKVRVVSAWTDAGNMSYKGERNTPKSDFDLSIQVKCLDQSIIQWFITHLTRFHHACGLFLTHGRNVGHNFRPDFGRDWVGLPYVRQSHMRFRSSNPILFGISLLLE